MRRALLHDEDDNVQISHQQQAHQTYQALRTELQVSCIVEIDKKNEVVLIYEQEHHNYDDDHHYVINIIIVIANGNSLVASGTGSSCTR